MTQTQTQTHGLRPAHVAVMAATCAFAVANVYYGQAMLMHIAQTFSSTEAAAGSVSAATHIGYLFGLLLLVPLGDRFERRSVILTLTGILVLALIAAGLAPNLPSLAACGLLIGCCSTLVSQVVPLAAHLADPGSRGRVLGQVMFGLLVGIVGSRTLAGFVSEWFGWQQMYFLSAAIMLAVGLLIWRILPKVPPGSDLSYRKLLGSLLVLFREEPVLRKASAISALLFCAFSAFWSVLVMYLAEPAFGIGSAGAGLFGLVGIAGAFVALLAGRVLDQSGPAVVIAAGIFCAATSFILFGLSGVSLIALMIGALLLDIGLQAVMVANQSQIYALRPNARSRLNTIYMVIYFLGGSAGATLAPVIWSVAGWPGVVAFGLVMTLAAAAVHLRLAGRDS